MKNATELARCQLERLTPARPDGGSVYYTLWALMAGGARQVSVSDGHYHFGMLTDTHRRAREWMLDSEQWPGALMAWSCTFVAIPNLDMEPGESFTVRVRVELEVDE